MAKATLKMRVTQLTEEYAHLSVYDADHGAGTILLSRATFDRLCGDEVFADVGDLLTVEVTPTGEVVGGAGQPTSSRTARQDHGE